MKLTVTEIKGRIEYIGDNIKQSINKACNLIIRQQCPSIRVIEVEVTQDFFDQIIQNHFVEVKLLPTDIDIESHINNLLSFVGKE